MVVMKDMGDKMGEVPEHMQRMKGVDVGNTGVSQPRMAARALRNPSMVSVSEGVRTFPTFDGFVASTTNLASFGESIFGDASTMNPSRVYGSNEEDVPSVLDTDGIKPMVSNVTDHDVSISTTDSDRV
ncbi:hypothetical protein Tco_0343145 [Tanacetum coccineum]